MSERWSVTGVGMSRSSMCECGKTPIYRTDPPEEKSIPDRLEIAERRAESDAEFAGRAVKVLLEMIVAVAEDVKSRPAPYQFSTKRLEQADARAREIIFEEGRRRKRESGG